MVDCACENDIKSKALRWQNGVLVRRCLMAQVQQAAPDAGRWAADLRRDLMRRPKRPLSLFIDWREYEDH